jgi:hypothetical protein
VCTFSCYNDNFLGIGFTLASEKKDVDLRSKALALPTIIKSQTNK